MNPLEARESGVDTAERNKRIIRLFIKYRGEGLTIPATLNKIQEEYLYIKRETIYDIYRRRNTLK